MDNISIGCHKCSEFAIEHIHYTNGDRAHIAYCDNKNKLVAEICNNLMNRKGKTLKE